MSDNRPFRRNSIKDWPCAKDCPDRHVGCHATCDRYAIAKARNDAKNAEIRAKRDAENAVNEYVVKRASKVKRTKLKER